MYHHVKHLMYRVNVGEPAPRFGRMLLEQFGGPNGELAAALQYTIQGLNCDDAKRKDLLMDIGTEELSHLEVIGSLARMHLKPIKDGGRSEAEADPHGGRRRPRRFADLYPSGLLRAVEYGGKELGLSLPRFAVRLPRKSTPRAGTRALGTQGCLPTRLRTNLA